MFKIINYPTDLTSAHNLIDMLIERLNENRSTHHEGDSIFHTTSHLNSNIPSGLNGGSEAEGRGVEFQFEGVHGVHHELA